MNKKNPERWHGAHHYSDKLHLFFIFFLFFSVATLLFFYVESHSEKLNYRLDKTQNIIPTQKACTEEAKLCPDGSVVFRGGPNCDFSECPSN